VALAPLTFCPVIVVIGAAGSGEEETGGEGVSRGVVLMPGWVPTGPAGTMGGEVQWVGWGGQRYTKIKGSPDPQRHEICCRETGCCFAGGCLYEFTQSAKHNSSLAGSGQRQ
jgi:hypothetical protein